MTCVTWFLGLLFGITAFGSEHKILRNPAKDVYDEYIFPDRTFAHYFIATASLFIGAVYTVYKSAENVSKYWFLGVITPSQIRLIGHISFGAICGAFLCLFSKFIFAPLINWIWRNIGRNSILFVVNFIAVRADRELKDLDFIDAFDPQVNINYLKNFLSQFPNATDESSLKFWQARKNSLEEGTLNYRVTVKSTIGSELIGFQVDRLPLEFWKRGDESFEARVIGPSDTSYRELTKAEQTKIIPHVCKW